MVRHDDRVFYEESATSAFAGLSAHSFERAPYVLPDQFVDGQCGDHRSAGQKFHRNEGGRAGRKRSRDLQDAQPEDRQP